MPEPYDDHLNDPTMPFKFDLLSENAPVSSLLSNHISLPDVHSMAAMLSLPDTPCCKTDGHGFAEGGMNLPEENNEEAASKPQPQPL